MWTSGWTCCCWLCLIQVSLEWVQKSTGVQVNRHAKPKNVIPALLKVWKFFMGSVKQVLEPEQYYPSRETMHREHSAKILACWTLCKQNSRREDAQSRCVLCWNVGICWTTRTPESTSEVFLIHMSKVSASWKTKPKVLFLTWGNFPTALVT